MDRRRRLVGICREYGLLAVYLFGSRAADGLALLGGGEVPSPVGSDLDVGVVFVDPAFEALRLGGLQVTLEDLFAPLRVDLVPLQRVDALLRFEAIDGHRVAATDPLEADRFEMVTMRQAAELLPIEKRLEADFFAAETS